MWRQTIGNVVRVEKYKCYHWLLQWLTTDWLHHLTCFCIGWSQCLDLRVLPLGNVEVIKIERNAVFSSKKYQYWQTKRTQIKILKIDGTVVTSLLFSQFEKTLIFSKVFNVLYNSASYYLKRKYQIYLTMNECWSQRLLFYHLLPQFWTISWLILLV